MPGLVLLDQLRQFGMLTIQATELAQVAGGRLTGQQAIDFPQAPLELIELGPHRGLHRLIAVVTTVGLRGRAGLGKQLLDEISDRAAIAMAPLQQYRRSMQELAGQAVGQ